MRHRRWQLFIILSGMYVIAYFYRVSAAVIAGDLTGDLDLSPAELGNISAGLFYAFALAQLPLGPLLDRVGPRKIVGLLGLVTAAGALLFAQAEDYQGALLGRILIGAGTASVLMGSFKAYTAWFAPRQFATLAGLQMALGNAGNLLATAPLAWMAGTFGWRLTFAGFGGLTALVAVLILLVVRDAPGPVEPAERLPLWQGWSQLFQIPSFWGYCLLAFFWYGSYMAVQGLWGGPYLQEVLGFDRGGAARLLLLTALGFMLGSPLAGRLSDRTFKSRKKVVAAGQFGLLAMTALFLGPLADLPVWLLPGVFFSLGLCVATGPILYAQVKEAFPPRIAATAMTTLNFFVVLGAALTQQLMGRVMSGATLSGVDAALFQRAFAIPVAGLALACLGYLFCRDTHPR